MDELKAHVGWAFSAIVDSSFLPYICQFQLVFCTGNIHPPTSLKHDHAPPHLFTG